MALADAVLQIADEMEKESEVCGPHCCVAYLKNYAQQLRLVVKASQCEAPPITAPTSIDTSVRRYEEIQQRLAAKAREELAAVMQRESQETTLAMCVGGPADGVMAPIAGGMPVGAKTKIDGAVYRLAPDHKLHHVVDDVTVT